MKVRVGRVTVHGAGLDARRLADRLTLGLHDALARAMNGAPPQPGLVDQAARAIAKRLKDEIATKGGEP
jgi:hypothetical protein